MSLWPKCHIKQPDSMAHSILYLLVKTYVVTFNKLVYIVL